MEQNINKPQPESRNDNTVQPETVSELVDRHLKDESHITTEEELRNATLEPGNLVTAEAPIDNDVITGELTENDSKYDKDEKKITPTPLDVLT